MIFEGARFCPFCGAEPARLQSAQTKLPCPKCQKTDLAQVELGHPARYIERLRLDSSLGDVRGVFVAQSIKPQAKVLAESRGFTWVEVDYDELRGMAPDELRLF